MAQELVVRMFETWLLDLKLSGLWISEVILWIG